MHAVSPESHEAAETPVDNLGFEPESGFEPGPRLLLSVSVC